MMPLRDDVVVLPQRSDDALRLGDYIAVVWRFRWLLIGAAIAAGALMFVKSISGPRVYESTVTFAATQSKVGDNAVVSTASTASFRPMVESLTTAAAVLKEFGLQGKIRPSEFLDKVMDVSEVRGTNLMRVTVDYTDPDTAAKMANSVAEHAVEMARQVAAHEAEHARDMIKVQLDEARKKLDEAEKFEKEYKQQAQLEAVKTDVNAQLNGRENLLDLTVSIASEEAKQARLAEELDKRKGSPGSSVYQEIDTELAASRAHLGSLQRQYTELVGVRKLSAPQLASLNHLYEIEGRVSRLKTERELAEKIYSEISESYQLASLQVASKSAELSVIDPAVPADRPVSRQVVRNTVVAAVVGFVLAMAGVLLWFTATEGRRAPTAR